MREGCHSFFDPRRTARSAAAHSRDLVCWGNRVEVITSLSEEELSELPECVV